MNEPSFLNRRQFIGQAGCAALGTTGMLSTLLNLGLATRVMAASPDDYKAMICIFLLGGNDSFNMLVPTNADEYAYYLGARGGLYDETNSPAGMALGAPGSATNALLPIQPSNIPGRGFGVHPRMPAFQQMFNDGSLAYVANVGSMQKPIANVAEYKQANLNNHPLGLFSHSDQQQQWQTCMPDKRSSIGWAGRAMDVLSNAQPKAQKSTFSISLAGTNVFQTGNAIVPYTMSTNGLIPLEGYKPFNNDSDGSLRDRVDYVRSQAVNELLGATYRNIFEQTYARATVDAQDSLAMFQDNLKNDEFPNWDASNASPLEKQLKLVANVIHAYKDSLTKRQTFFLTVGGYDTVLPPVPKDQPLPPVPNATPPPFEGAKTFYHPASGVVILGIDWLVFCTDVVTGFMALPVMCVLSFFVSFALVYAIQTKWARNSASAAMGKAFMGAFLVGLPFPITGTLLGAGILILAGLPTHPIEVVKKIAERGQTARF